MKLHHWIDWKHRLKNSLVGSQDMEHSGSVGRVLDWASNGIWLKPHHRQSHCVVCWSKTLYPLLSTGSTQEDTSLHDFKIVDWNGKNQTK